MMPDKIQSLLFDLDETLVDRTETMRRFLLNQHSRFKSELVVTASEFANSVLQHQKNGYANKHTAYQLACLDLLNSDEIADELFDDFKKNYGEDAVLFDGVREVLETLSQSYILGIVTNGRSHCQNAKIDSLKVRHLFKVIKISEEFGAKKPDSSIFNSCLEDLGVESCQCICIGDNPNNDLKPAKELGMKTIWVRNNHFEAPTDVDSIIDSVTQIIPMLRKFQS